MPLTCHSSPLRTSSLKFKLSHLNQGSQSAEGILTSPTRPREPEIHSCVIEAYDSIDQKSGRRKMKKRGLHHAQFQVKDGCMLCSRNASRLEGRCRNPFTVPGYSQHDVSYELWQLDGGQILSPLSLYFERLPQLPTNPCLGHLRRSQEIRGTRYLQTSGQSPIARSRPR